MAILVRVMPIVGRWRPEDKSQSWAASHERRNTNLKEVLDHAQFDAPIAENGPRGLG